MYSHLLFTFLYPYPYQTFAFLVSTLLLMVFGLIGYWLIRLITWKMKEEAMDVFFRILVISGITVVVLLFASGTVSLITIMQVNKQLGFAYGTPDTPEGELFEISRVVDGKTMYMAGLKVGDQVQFDSVNDLYRLLVRNQGRSVGIPVRRNKRDITILIQVPELQVPLAGVSFLII